MKKPLYFDENNIVNRLLNRAFDSIGEEGFISLFTREYASLTDIERYQFLNVILNEYQVSITQFIYHCLEDYSLLHKSVQREYEIAHKLYINDNKDELAKARYKTWALAKERLSLQKRLILQCVIDYSCHISSDLENELKSLI